MEHVGSFLGNEGKLFIQGDEKDLGVVAGFGGRMGWEALDGIGRDCWAAGVLIDKENWWG